MNTVGRASMALLAVLSIGCQNARVHDQDGKSVPGIPFFAKKVVFKQTSSYEVRGLLVTLRLDPKPGAAAQSRLVAADAAGQAKVQALRTAIAGCRSAAADICRSSVQAAFDSLPAFDTTAAPKELVGNAVEAVVVVDGSRTLYLNSWFPVFGSTTVAPELAADGTLSKATVSTTSEWATVATSFLPVKELLTGKLAPAQATKMVTGAAGPEMPECEISGAGFIYDFVGFFPNDPRVCAEPPACTARPIPFDLAGGLFMRRPAGAAADKKDEGKKVGFSGEVTLPENKE
jgi:hypothetical protein